MMDNSIDNSIEKICVHAKMQNRMALGIMHAYMKLHPDATLDDLNKAFPDELNPDKGVKEIFVSKELKGTDAKWNGYFFEDPAYLHLKDSSDIAVVSMWTKPSLERLVSHAKQYGITVCKEENSQFGGNEAKFSLEYLNGFSPVVKEKNKCKKSRKSGKVILWSTILVLLGLLLYLILK